MSIENPTFSTNPEVDSSIGNLFDKSTIYTAFIPAGHQIDILKESGYRGVEWLPMRATVAGTQMNLGMVGQDTKDAVVSLHQSYRSEKSLGEAIRHPNKVLAVASYVFLPERVASLDNLERLQKIVGRELPVVLYPENEGEASGTDRVFTEKTFQPTAEVMHRWGVNDVPTFIAEAEKRGYTGFCVDLAHMRGAPVDGHTLHPWQETLPQLLPFTQEIHVSAGRFDMPYQNTEEELKDLIKGTKYTELPRMLETVRDSGWQGRVVTEIPALSLHQLRGSSSFMPISHLIEDHKEIVYNVKTLLS